MLTVKGVKFRSAKQPKRRWRDARRELDSAALAEAGVAVFDVNVKAASNFANADGLKVGRKIEITGIDGETISASLGR